MERLGELVRALLVDHPDLDVLVDAQRIPRLAEGSTIILLPNAEHGAYLNEIRPIIVQRNLKIILFSNSETTIALKNSAPDFLDWISKYQECPDGPVPYAVAGLRAAIAADALGVLWTESDDELGGIWKAISAGFPGETLTWIMPQRDSMTDEILSAGTGWVACRARAETHVRGFRLALARTQKRGRVVLVTPIHVEPGLWPVHDRMLSLAKADRRLQEVGATRALCLAAMVDLEPEAVELARQLVKAGITHSTFVTLLAGVDDAGAIIARKAYELGLVNGTNALWPPVLREKPERFPRVVVALEIKTRAIVLGACILLLAFFGVVYLYKIGTDSKVIFSVVFFLLIIAGVVREWIMGSNVSNRNAPHTEADNELLRINRIYQAYHEGPVQYLDFYYLAMLFPQQGYPAESLASRAAAQLNLQIALDQGDYSDARTLLTENVLMEGRIVGVSKASFVELMVELALYLQRQGDSRGAMALLAKPLASERLAEFLGSPSNALPAILPFSDSETIEYVRLYVSQPGPVEEVRPEIRARALRILAESMISQGRYEETEIVAEAAQFKNGEGQYVAPREAYRAIDLQGRACSLAGRYEPEGKSLLRKAVALAEKTVGKMHFETARLMLDRTRTAHRHGDPEAVALAKETIDLLVLFKAKEWREEALVELTRIASS